MATIVLSVPHTGTRFTMSFMDRVGVIYRQHHSDGPAMTAIQHEAPCKAVIPVRDPLLCFTTTLMQAGEDKFDRILMDVLYQYSLLFEAQTWFECEHLWLDADDHDAELAKIAAFCDAPIPSSDFVWEPVGVTGSAPTSYALWELLAKRLGSEKADKALSYLAAVRGVYGY